MKRLHISEDLSLPADAITQTFATLGKRGSGKTNLASVMAEEMYVAGLPFVAVDPVGSWWGLRSSRDGKGPGLSIPIFGGEHGDVPLERTGGVLLADLVVDERLSCVLDVSEFSEGDKIRFLIDFAERLFRRNRDPLHLFLEEADDFIPQRVMREQARLLGAWQRLVKRGRFKGLGETCLTQRSAALNKDVLTQTETLFVFRTTSPQDRKAVEGWLEFHGQSKEVLESLPSLADGECWVWSPHWLGKLVRVQIRRRETFDSGATPTDVKGRRTPSTMADVDLSKISAQMVATRERAKAMDPKELQREVARLKGELARQPERPRAAPTVKEVRVEVPILKDGQITRLESLVDRWLKGSEAVTAGARELAAAVAKAHNGHHTAAPGQVQSRLPARITIPTASLSRPQRASGDGESRDDVALKAGARRILEVMAARYPMTLTTAQVRTLAGLRKSGTSDTYLSLLKREGLIEDHGGILMLTDRGLDVAPVPLAPLEPIESWRSKFKAGARKMLDVALAHPRGITKEDLLEQTGLKKSGTSDTYFSTLRRNGLITYDGHLVRVGEILLVPA